MHHINQFSHTFNKILNFKIMKKTENQQKLNVKKFQIAKISNLKAIIGGYRDDGGTGGTGGGNTEVGTQQGN